MKKKILVLVLVQWVLVVVALFYSKASFAFDAAQTFQKKCTSCHTIGGGVLVGPDLKGITERRSSEWIIKFVQSSGSVIKGGDVEAVKLYNQFNQKDMPDHALADQDILAIVKYIESGNATASAGQIKPADKAVDQDIQFGRQIYLGQKPLANAGPACVSCHSVGTEGPLGGGTFAKDLTHVFSRYQDKGLDAALKNIAFPVMAQVYATQALTEDEIYQLRSYLYLTDRTLEESDSGQKKFIFLGTGGAVFMMGVIDFVWRRRRKNSVRRTRGGLR